MSNWIERESKYLFQNYGRQPIVIERGEGSRVWDSEGNEYLDFVGGLAVTSLGHSHPAVTAAASAQAERLIHVSNLYYTTPMIELAELLVENSPLDRVFFCNSGAEAIETAIKIARRWGHDELGGKHGIIAMQDGFHGRTLGALAATGTARYREPFEPLPAGFSHVPWNDLDALRAATDDNTVAVLMEPIQGEGGVNAPAPGYLQGVRQWCDENGLLLILDEIQSGIGRTGTLWAHEQDGIEPDIMCIAKGLAGDSPSAPSLPARSSPATSCPVTTAQPSARTRSSPPRASRCSATSSKTTCSPPLGALPSALSLASARWRTASPPSRRCGAAASCSPSASPARPPPPSLPSVASAACW